MPCFRGNRIFRVTSIRFHVVHGISQGITFINYSLYVPIYSTLLEINLENSPQHAYYVVITFQTISIILVTAVFSVNLKHDFQVCCSSLNFFE